MVAGQTKTDHKADFQENLLKAMDSMYNLGYRLTMNREEAFDLVQDASLRAFRFYHKFEKGTNFKAWILTILRNLFINQYRKRAREPFKVEYDKVEQFVGAPDPNGIRAMPGGGRLAVSAGGLSRARRSRVRARAA